MSDDKNRPDSEKSRQELLDEIYYLRDVAGEREQQIRRLQAGGAGTGLGRIRNSRLWRFSAPLRWLARISQRRRRAEPDTTKGSSQPDAPKKEANSQGADRVVSPVRAATILEPREEGARHLYVDITELALHEGRTGVQRVTREILKALLVAPPGECLVRPVYTTPGQPYRLAEKFAARLLGTGKANMTDPPMDARAGDVFLGLDHAMPAVVEHAADLKLMRERGIRIWFVCNDTLPLDHPEWFPAEIKPRFEAWLRVVLGVADGVACISRATEAGLRRWLDDWGMRRERPLALAHFALGADLAASEPGVVTINAEEFALLQRLRGMSSFLMVGTLEPRKGHAQALEAFNLLWARGDDAALVIVGLPGWMTDVVQRRIRHHDEFGKRLFWFMNASDAFLAKLYATCTVLLAPSDGEGFGLPLVEAARQGLPILCRDLPIFREVAGEHASYFESRDATQLAYAIRVWLDSFRSGTAPASTGMPWLTWMQSAQVLLRVVFGNGLRDESWYPECLEDDRE